MTLEEDILQTINPEKFLREAFTELEIAKKDSKYPDSVQRFYIYQAMREVMKESAKIAREKIKEALNAGTEIAYNCSGGRRSYDWEREEIEINKYLKENGLL